MNVCPTCGNDVEPGVDVCPYCGQQLDPDESTPSIADAPSPVAEVNIKAGRPTVRVSLLRLETALEAARSEDRKMLRIVHGYGASGSGGEIKAAVHEYLEDLLERRSIRGYVAGDRYSAKTPRVRDLLKRYPELGGSLRVDRNNPGITFVEL